MDLPECPVELTLSLIGSKWKVLILRDLNGGEKRFSELLRSLGSSRKVLASTLKSMSADGLVSRTVHPESPLKVEYSLTDTGKSLRPILDAMISWGEWYSRVHSGKS